MLDVPSRKSLTIKRKGRGVGRAIKLCKLVTIQGCGNCASCQQSARVDSDGAGRAFGSASDKATINIETRGTAAGTNRLGAACTTRRLTGSRAAITVLLQLLDR